MTFCQAVLKAQFPAAEGLQCTLLQSKQKETKIQSGIQVIYLKACAHWILASNIGSDKSQLNIYDSVFTSGDSELLDVLNRLFEFTKYNFVKFQKQIGDSDCGLFVIAAMCALLFDCNPSSCCFKQELMRDHLTLCIENCFYSPFP